MHAETAFGSWLKQRRKELGVTQDELVQRIDCSLATLQKIESGARRPSRQITLLLAEYFGIRADELEAFITFARSGSTAPASGGSRAPWRAAHLEKTNLPATLTSLIGREREVAEVSSLLLQPKVRLLTLIGAPGIGKTRLGLKVASDLMEHFDDGVFFVDLAPVDDPDLVLPAIAYTLGLKEEANRPSADVLLDFVRERRMLLLLDNFEQVLDAAHAIVRLVQSSPWLKIIVTSREALHVRGERRYAMNALGYPLLKTSNPRQVADLVQLVVDYPSVSLFVERAQAVEPDFMLDEGNATAVVEICRRLGGLPLAIELIAARSRLFHPAVLLAHLEEIGELRLLTGEARDLPARHRSLRGAIMWSYDLLSGDEQKAFRRLGVFAGGFTPEAAAAVCSEPGSLSFDTVERIASLADKSLLSTFDDRLPDGGQEPANGPARRTQPYQESRFAMLETIRRYALEKLRDEGETEETQQRHAVYFTELAERTEPELKGPNQARWLARLERENSNLQAALEWASDHDAEITVRLMFALRRFWYIRGRYAENSKWRKKALAVSNEAQTSVRARALYLAAEYAGEEVNDELARAYIEECIALARQAGDKALLSDAQAQLGYIFLEQADYAKARELFEESLVLDRERGNSYGVCWLLTALGETARAEGEYTQAQAYYQEGLLLAREAENKYNIAHLVGNLGSVALAQGDDRRATPLIAESLALFLELGYEDGIISNLSRFVGVAVAQGQHSRAAKLSGAVDELLQTENGRLDIVDRSVYEDSVATARYQLDEEQWNAARKVGQALTMDEAIAEVLRS